MAICWKMETLYYINFQQAEAELLLKEIKIFTEDDGNSYCLVNTKNLQQ